MEILIAVVSKVAEKLIDPVWNLVSSPVILVYNYEKNVKDLKKKVDDLKEEKEDVELFIKEIERSGQVSSSKHQSWIDQTDKVILASTEDKEMKKKKEKAEMKYFCGLCRNPVSLYKLSKIAVENAKSIDEQLKEAKESLNLPPAYGFAPTERVPGSPVPGYQDFPSRKVVLDNIMTELRSARVNRIGLHGMAGAGKSMMVKEVRRKAEVEKLFERVVLVKVTVKPDLKLIRDELARGLGMTQLSVELTSQRVTDMIKAKLEILAEKGKVLFILDDVWAKIDLEGIGISFPETDPSGEECFKWKILFTSRDRNVFYDNDIGSGQVFSIGKLTQVEGKDMFVEIAGGEHESTVLQIVEECGRLPLAIATLANALRGRDFCEWEDALIKLRSPSPHNFSGVSKSIYAAIEMSYNQLKSKELKQIFLLFGILGSNFSLEILLKYGIGLDLFPQAYTMEEAQADLLTLTKHLKDASLLIEGSDGGGNSFDMHDITRDVAVSIARKDHYGLLLKDSYEPKEWHHAKVMKCFKWVLLQNSDVSELPKKFKSSDLVFFGILNKGRCCLKIPGNFFEGMPRLQVLHLCQMDPWSFLPSSICRLKNLHTLSLEQSKFEDLSLIGELKSLEVLSLSGSAFKLLPQEIGQLTRLLSLDLSNCDELQDIPPHVLGKLSRLEELYLANSFVEWEHEERSGDDQQRASLAELKNLKKLVALEVCIGDIQMIPTGFLLENLKKYKVFIGGDVAKNHVDDYFESSRMVKLQLMASPNVNYSVKEQLFNYTEELYLEKLSQVGNVIDELYDEGFQHLKYLSVKNASDVHHIINSEQMFPVYAFPVLEELFLYNLVSLKNVFQGWITDKSLTKLTKITVESCDQMQNLFSFTIASQLVKLQQIDVQDCKNVKEIVDDEQEAGGGRHDSVVETPSSSKDGNTKFGEKLRSLRLQRLSNLIGFTSSCKNQSLFSDKVVISNLEELILSSIHVGSIWSTPSSSLVKNLVNLRIEACNGLKHLFSLSMARDLQNLKFLHVGGCKKMKTIISKQDEEEKALIFQKLESLHISGHENLVQFYKGNCTIKFPSLKQLTICRCRKMERFIASSTNEDVFFNGQGEFPILESMYLSDLEHMTKIWKYQQFKTCFRILKSLVVSYCANLTTIFPAIVVAEKTRRAGKIDKWKSSMEKIEITSCNSVKVIFEIGGINVDSGAGHDQLNEINIDDLPELEHVWDKDPPKTLSFKNLEKVSIVDCPKTRYVFPASIAGNLLQLQSLCLLSSGMETIVDAAVPPDSEQVVKFEFPQLSSLTLRELSKLHCFYPGQHVIVWPMLKKFEFGRCIVLAMKTESTNGSDKLDFPVDLPLFSLKQIINRFRKLSLCESDIEMLSGREFKGGSLSNIQHLLIQDYNDSASVDFPIEFLQKLCSLEKLDVEFCNFKELFPSKGGRLVERLSSKIKNLRLDGLNDLERIWSEESSNALPNLEVLKVNSCHSLCTLSKSSNPSSWINLTTLEVTDCSAMENLVSPTTARSLVQLQSMTVAFCRNLVHVVGNEEEAGTSTTAIVFQKLRYLKLKVLTRMASFCSMKNYKLEFPSLKQVVVEHCPNLRIFFEGELITTPQLNKVVLNELENNWQWNSGLNETIEAMHRDKVEYAHSEHLELSAFPELIEKWYNEQLDLGRLQCLVISDCDKLETFLLTPSMASKLVVLKKLYVINCRTIEQVIKGSEEAQGRVITFQVLNIILLQDCYNLTSFYKGSDNRLEFPALHCLDAVTCPNMVTFAHFTSSEAPNQPQCLSFFGNKVVLLELNILILVDMSSMNKIWGDELDEKSFKHLYRVFVHSCPKLLNIFPSSVLKRLQKLNRIEINNCGLVQEVLESDQQGGSQESLFSQLDRVWFKDLPKLKRFCSGNVQQLQTLKDLRIIECPLLKSLISSPNVSQDNSAAFFDAKVALPKLEMLMLKGMDNLNKLWDAQLDYADSFRKLYHLSVNNCGKVENIFPSSMLENGRLQSLGRLQILDCDSMKEIVEPQSSRDIGASEETIIKIPLPNLTEVKLYRLPQLKCFCSYNRKFEFPSLEEVIVMDCRRMPFFSKHESLTPKLQSVKLMANYKDEEDHQELWEGDLNVTILEMFLQKVGYSSMNVLEFSDRFPELIHAWNQGPQGIILRHFKMLTVLEFFNIEKLTFALTPSMALGLEQLVEFRVINCASVEQVIASNEEGYHRETMLFPKMEELELHDLPKLTSFGSGNSFEFPSLTQLGMSNCPLLETFISSNSKNTSQDLTVSSEKEVDDDTSYKPALFDAKVAFHVLKSLRIGRMESLNKIWDDQIDANSFCQLDFIGVHSCHKLSYIFPFSMVGRLQTLNEMEIWSCNSLVEIFGSSQSQSHVMEIIPKLTSMSLFWLLELKGFFPQTHIIEFPSLTKLEVSGCHQIQILACAKEDNQLEIVDKCSLFWVTKATFLALKELRLERNKSMEEIWHGQHPQDYFPELQVIQLNDFPEQLVEPQSLFFQSLPKLEKLLVDYKVKAFKNNVEEETGRTGKS